MTARIPIPAVSWPEVLRAVPRDETRSYALSRFRDSGFSADSFGHRRTAREALCEALIATEDWIEAERGEA